MKRSKRYKKSEKLVEDKIYTLKEAVETLTKMAECKFDETLEFACKLNVDSKQSDQMVRGAVVLPHGIGKEVKVLVFCEPEKEAQAREAGADYVGAQDFVDKIEKEGWYDFDYCIATPSMMRVVSKLGRTLGPRGLMPSPKTGTVTDNVAFAVKEAKRGKVDYRMDKTGGVCVGLGKMSFTKDALLENAQAFVDSLLSVKPPSVKGELFKNYYLSRTMSPSLRVQL